MWETLLASGAGGKSSSTSSGGDFNTSHGGNVFSPANGFEFSTQNILIIGLIVVGVFVVLQKGKK